MFSTDVEGQNVPALKYYLTRVTSVCAVHEVWPGLLQSVGEGSLGVLGIVVAQVVGGGEDLPLLRALRVLHLTKQATRFTTRACYCWTFC